MNLDRMPLKRFPERIAFGKIVEINSMTHVQKFDSHQLPIGSEIHTTSVIQAFSMVI